MKNYFRKKSEKEEQTEKSAGDREFSEAFWGV